MAPDNTKEVILNGFLGEKYGTTWRMIADSYADIFGCIEANHPGFTKDIIDLAEAGGDLSIDVGGNLVEEFEQFFVPLSDDTIIITPIPAGAKSGTAKGIVGALLVAAAFFIPGGQFAIPAFLGPQMAAMANMAIITIGANLAIMGLQQMLAPDPSVDQDNTDYLFEGPENTTVAGACVPVLCGEMIIGGVVISAGTVGGNHVNEATFVGRPAPAGVWDGGLTINGSIPPDFDTYFPNEPNDPILAAELRFQAKNIKIYGVIDEF